MNYGYRHSFGSRVFGLVNTVLMILVMVITLYPFYNQILVSIASPADVFNVELLLLPTKLDFSGWIVIGHYQSLWRGYMNTIIRVALGVTLSVFCTALMAYPLSKPQLPFNRLVTTLIVITMFFSGGLIPTYMLIRSLGLFNTIWVMVLPGMVSGFNVFIMRNFLKELPESLEESARMDGASYLLVFFAILIPLSKPVLATIALWVGVAHWQEWFSNLLYIQTPRKWVMMMIARKILIEQDYATMDAARANVGMRTTIKGAPNEQQMRAAVIVVSVAPMLIIYPFLQRYFVKGITLGAVKG
jgi:putative aldouronate transport system permease protein